MIFNKNWFIKKINRGMAELNKRQEMREQFKHAIDVAKYYHSSREYNYEEKSIILNYIMNTIKIDMQSEYIVDLFYHSDAKEIPRDHFPLEYYDENGNKHELISGEPQMRLVSLKDDYVITFPWNVDRIKDNILNITKNGFRYFSNNHFAYYYSEVDLCIVCNGNHSIASGIYNKDGTIQVKVVDIAPLFQHVSTDGAYFFNRHTNEIVWGLQDFRIAILFEIAKMKYNIIEPEW
jgi:hypothetical protein